MPRRCARRFSACTASASAPIRGSDAPTRHRARCGWPAAPACPHGQDPPLRRNGHGTAHRPSPRPSPRGRRTAPGDAHRGWRACGGSGQAEGNAFRAAEFRDGRMQAPRAFLAAEFACQEFLAWEAARGDIGVQQEGPPDDVHEDVRARPQGTPQTPCAEVAPRACRSKTTSTCSRARGGQEGSRRHSRSAAVQVEPPRGRPALAASMKARARRRRCRCAERRRGRSSQDQAWQVGRARRWPWRHPGAVTPLGDRGPERRPRRRNRLLERGRFRAVTNHGDADADGHAPAGHLRD